MPAQDELAALSTNSVHRTLADADHAMLAEHQATAANRAWRSAVGGAGGGRLETIDVRHRRAGVVDTMDVAAVFILIGAEPFTQWLPREVARDDWGYVTTGPSEEAASRLPFEATLPGVFAVGDVRHGSTKRVASAAGEGAVCVRLVHDFLALQRER